MSDFTTQKERFKESKVFEIETLLKAVRRYNLVFMEDAGELIEIAENKRERDDKEVIAILGNNMNDLLERTWEVDTILSMILDKIQPFSEVESEFRKLERATENAIQ